MNRRERRTGRADRLFGLALAGIVLTVWGCDGKASLANLPNQSDNVTASAPTSDGASGDTSTAPGASGYGSEEKPMAQWKSSGCDTPVQTGDYNGKSQRETHLTLGEPSSTEQFLLGEGATEFRIGLLSVFSMEKDGDRTIREETWVDGDCRLTLWLAQDDDVWSVRQGLVWPGDAEF